MTKAKKGDHQWSISGSWVEQPMMGLRTRFRNVSPLYFSGCQTLVHIKITMGHSKYPDAQVLVYAN
jgi:hypothetical protein